MKWLIPVAFAALAVLIMLAPTFGYDVGLQGVLDLLAQALTEIADFFTKFWEGLL